MAFRFRADLHAGEEVRRVASQRLGKAITSLERGSSQDIHDARKRLKETRALLRLVRPVLGKRRFGALNSVLRDSGRAVSEQRDAAAMIECWDELAGHAGERFSEEDLLAVRERLVERARTASSVSDLEPVLEGLREVLGTIPDWPLGKWGFALFKEGIRLTYADGRDASAAARRWPTDERLHDWRKRVKDHWYQTRLLQDAWPHLFKARRKALEALADDLGDDHDLAVLQALLTEEPELFGAPETRSTVAQAIDQLRSALQNRAWVLGARLYAEAPKALVRRWKSYWRVGAGIVREE